VLVQAFALLVLLDALLLTPARSYVAPLQVANSPQQQHAQQQQPGAPPPAQPQQEQLCWVLGEPRSEAEAVTALGFSTLAVAGDSLWVAAGHLSGALLVWDLSKRAPRQVASIVHHSLPITHVSFFPGKVVVGCWLQLTKQLAASGYVAGCTWLQLCRDVAQLRARGCCMAGSHARLPSAHMHPAATHHPACAEAPEAC
jgi:hypothetical protein